MLQPLVENAVLHGITRLPAGGTIDIELATRPDGLHVSVHNPAPPPASATSPWRAAEAPDTPSAASPIASLTPSVQRRA